MQVFILSKQNSNLSTAEVLSLLEPKKVKHTLIDNLLIINTSKNLLYRLAYTKQVNKLLFITTKKQLIKAIQDFNWKKVYKKNFAVRIYGGSISERGAGGLIWKKLQQQGIKPKVNLKKPTTLIEIFMRKNKAVVTLFKEKQTEPFESRKAHLRPELSPISLHPRLARCLVNLTGIQTGTLLDPFCGTGGILIEAALIKLKPIGFDISKRMINTSRINLKHYKLNATLKQQDSTMITKKYKYIVADLPYGISTSPIKLRDTYEKFLKTLKKILIKQAVLTFPNKIPKALFKKHKLKISATFDYYIHRSLTKKIVIVK